MLDMKNNPVVQEVPTQTKWPRPITPQPSLDELEELDGDCYATDGCIVEIDSVCEHGHPSWLLRIGMV
jgi:hypothetical protein